MESKTTYVSTNENVNSSFSSINFTAAKTLSLTTHTLILIISTRYQIMLQIIISQNWEQRLH